MAYTIMDYDHRKIQEIVEEAMNEHEELKDHVNREKLWLLLKSKYPGMRISAESVNRAQRRLWEANKCMPTNPNKLIEWYCMRIKGVEEYLKVYGRRG
jgi:hypothetical protein